MPDPNASLTSASVWMVQFEAIKNPTSPSNYEHDALGAMDFPPDLLARQGELLVALAFR